MSEKKHGKGDGEKITAKTFLLPAAYLAPFLLGIVIFELYPFFNVIFISFKEDYKILSSGFSGFGFSNYAEILQDPTFLLALKNTGLYVAVVVPVSLALAMMIAVLLNRSNRLQGVLQTAFFLPMVTSATAVGLVWRWLFNYDYGIFNFIMTRLGLHAVNWLNDPKIALISLIIYGIWSILPFTIILLLAGLQNINRQYFVAARVDGAGSGLILRTITIPLLAPTLCLVLIINTISCSKVFMELFPLYDGQPGPAYSLYTVIYYLYEMFYVKWELGPAAASAVILFLLVFVLTMLQLLFARGQRHRT